MSAVARPKYPTVNNVDFGSMGHSDPKKTQGGAGVAIVYSRKSDTDRSNVIYQLCVPDPCLLRDDTPRKTREECMTKLPWIRTGFHLQENPTHPALNGRYTVFLGLPDAISAEMKRCDDANISTVVTNAPKWFKRGNLDPVLVKAQHTPVVFRYPQTNEVPEDQKTTVLRTKIIDDKTEILVQSPDNYKVFTRGDIKSLRLNARVVPVLQDGGIYFRSMESGGQQIVKRILVLHGSADEENGDFDTGGIDIEIQENFEVPDENENMDSDAPAGSVSEQTVVGGPAPDWNSTAPMGDAVPF